MQNVAYKAYGAVTSRTMDDKQLELAVFRQITAELRNVDATPPRNLAMWADAVSRNLELWTVLAADLMRPGNALPDDTRRSLLQLAEFVRRESMSILSGSGSIEDIVEINETIIKGLETEADSPSIEAA